VDRVSDSFEPHRLEHVSVIYSLIDVQDLTNEFTSNVMLLEALVQSMSMQGSARHLVHIELPLLGTARRFFLQIKAT
jgi:hypothetical protein